MSNVCCLLGIKEFKHFNPKEWFLSFRKYDSGWSSRIRILIFYPSWIPVLGVKKEPDFGSGSRIRIRNTAGNEQMSRVCCLLGQARRLTRDHCPSDPDSDFLPILDPGSKGQKYTGSRIRIRNTAGNEEMSSVCCLLGQARRLTRDHCSSDPDPDFFTHLGSRIQGSKSHRIPDPDPQHCWHEEVS